MITLNFSKKISVWLSQAAKLCLFIVSISVVSDHSMAEQRLFYNVNIILYLSSVLEGSLSNTMMRLYIGKARIYNWRTAVGHAIPGCVLISLLALLFLTLESEISFKYTPLIITLVFLRIIYKVIFGLNWSNSFNLRDRYLEALLYFWLGL